MTQSKPDLGVRTVSPVRKKVLASMTGVIVIFSVDP
jgi:hypothetical protein